MKFEIVPILSAMEELYERPISMNRFRSYLSKLQGGTQQDFLLPIGSHNPIAKHKVNLKI